MKTKKPTPKKRPLKKFYKIVNTVKGHHGVFYKLGRNTDPNPRPLELVGSCQKGALYFSEAKHLHQFLGYGDKIAVMTAKEYMKDSDGDKFKATTINILKFMDNTAENLLKIPGISKSEVCSYFDLKKDVVRKLLKKDEDWLQYLLDTDSDERKLAKELIAFYDANPVRGKKFMVKVRGYGVLIEELIDKGRMDMVPFDLAIEDVVFRGKQNIKVKKVKKLIKIHGDKKVLKELLNYI